MRRVFILGLSALLSSALAFWILYSVCELVAAIFGVHSQRYSVTKII